MVDEFTHEDALTFASSTEDIWLSRETVPYSFPTINGKCMLATTSMDCKTFRVKL